MTTLVIEHLHRVSAWLADLADLTARDNHPLPLAERIAAIASMLADNFQSDDAFTRASLDHVAQQCRFFPSYAEAYQALAAWWKANRPLPSASLALEAPERAPYVPPDAETQAAVHAVVADLAADFQARADFQRKADFAVLGQSRPGHFSDGQLLVLYENLAAAGNLPALSRLEMLRKKLANSK